MTSLCTDYNYTCPDYEEPEIKKCLSCNDFWGWPEWNDLCSHCGNPDIDIKINKLIYEDGFREKLDNWAKEKVVNDIWYSIIKKSANKYNGHESELYGLINILKEIREKDLYISSKQAKHILRNCGKDDMVKSRVICSFIIDWWNMKVGFNSAEICYFTDSKTDSENDYYIDSIPPKYLNNRKIILN